MDDPRELILCDVRCFQDVQRGNLRPITLLVGENSTGKTTFLGCYRALHQAFAGFDLDSLLDFNEEPFVMGSFRDIVRSRRGPGGRIDDFQLGLSVVPKSTGGIPSYRVLITFRDEDSQPAIASFRFEFQSDSFLELQRDPEGTVLRTPDRQVAAHFPFGQAVFLLDYLMALVDDDSQTFSPPSQGLQPVADYLRDLFLRHKPKTRKTQRAPRKRIGVLRPQLPELIPIAPLRSKPMRTYNPVSETASPEGGHIPMLMMRLSRTNQSHWKSLHEDLVAFGRGSGLFSDIKVKRHGRQMSDPFQLQVKVRTGPHANITDVGYGVSQSLPILVDVMAATESDRGGGRRRRDPGGRMFLLQQPEVHLHPRGQAELANLFVDAFRKSGSRFLIETHSDYIVDRMRIAVRKGAIKSDDVSILYFEPTGNAVTIHNMTLDDYGNLEGAPPGYRDFFLKETDQLLGFSD